MKNKTWALALAVGSKVFWVDPDRGASSGIYTVRGFNSDTGKVVDEDTVISLSNGWSEAEATVGELRPVSFGLQANTVAADLLVFARRALAALETPGDLNEEGKAQVIEDGGELIAAIEDAIRDREAVQVIVNGIEAATAVVNNWEEGDLAGAVNVLDGWIEEAQEAQSPDLDGLVATVLMDGIDRAQSVVRCWESKHLASAVSDLEGWLEEAVTDLAEAGLLPSEKPTVVVELSGGVASGVSAIGNVRVLVLDYDNGSDDDDAPEIPGRNSAASIADHLKPGDPAFVHRVIAVVDGEE